MAPLRNSFAPFLTSVPEAEIKDPFENEDKIATLSLDKIRVCSIGTTASALGGRYPPVDILAACPEYNERLGIFPYPTFLTMLRVIGVEGEAYLISAAITAIPSM